MSSTKKMKAAILKETKNIIIEEIDIPVPKKDEALIRVRAVGICGSDVHYYERGRIGPYIVKEPIILGHEVAGEIVELGSDVENLSVGQRVAVEPGMTCGKCDFCKSGHYNLCKKVEFLATPPYNGAFCEYITMRSEVLFPIPDSMSYEEGALVEPFSVGLHAVSRGDLKVGETVAIMGMGPIGLMTAIAAKAAGAKRIIGVDMEDFRLKKALELGVTETINLRIENPESTIKRLTNEIGVDLAIETAGNGKALQSALSVVRRGGRVVIVGLPPEDQTALNVPYIVDNEISIHGVFRYRNTYKLGIDILSGSGINLEPIITDRMSLSEIPEAFEKAISQKSNTLKIMIHL